MTKGQRKSLRRKVRRLRLTTTLVSDTLDNTLISNTDSSTTMLSESDDGEFSSCFGDEDDQVVDRSGAHCQVCDLRLVHDGMLPPSTACPLTGCSHRGVGAVGEVLD